jgi:hypothetical protein
VVVVVVSPLNFSFTPVYFHTNKNMKGCCFVCSFRLF